MSRVTPGPVIPPLILPELIFKGAINYTSHTVSQCKYANMYPGIEFKDFILGFRQSNFLCTTLKCIEKFRIPLIKSGIPASNLGSSEARNPAKFAACVPLAHSQ